MKQVSLLEEKYELLGELREESKNLKYYSNAFRITGNNDMADILLDIGNNIEMISSRLHDIDGEELNERVETANKSVASTLSACLNIGGDNQ